MTFSFLGTWGFLTALLNRPDGGSFRLGLKSTTKGFYLGISRSRRKKSRRVKRRSNRLHFAAR